MQEQKRIEANNHNAGEVLRIENLTKIFHRPMGGKVYAVDNVTLGIKSGEVKCRAPVICILKLLKKEPGADD